MPFTAFVDELLPAVRKSNEVALDARVDGAVGEYSIRLSLAGGNAGERADRFVDGMNGVNMESTLCHGAYNVFVQHQMLHVVSRDQHTLAARQALPATEVEESLDLFIDAANRLHMAVLIDRSSDG